MIIVKYNLNIETRTQQSFNFIAL